MKFEVNTKWLKFSLGGDDDLVLLYLLIVLIIGGGVIGTCVATCVKDTPENMRDILIDSKSAPNIESTK